VSVTNTLRVVQYTLDGATLAYTVPYVWYDPNWIMVTRQTGIATPVTLSNGADYTLLGQNESTGTLTLVSAGTAGDLLTISRTVPLTQLSLFTDRGAYLGQNTERALDTVVMMAQQLVGGGLLPTGVNPAIYALPMPSADKVIGWNSTATALINIAKTTIVTDGGGGGGGSFNLLSYAALGAVPANDDLLLVYDTSAGAHKSVRADLAVGTLLGDARYKLSADQALTAGLETTVSFASLQHNVLQLGVYSTGTFTYTATVGCRISVSALATILSQSPGGSGYITVQKNGVDVYKFFDKVESDGTSRDLCLPANVTIALAAGDVVRVRVQSSVAKSISSTAGMSSLCMEEKG
jgi:hypothetical protein